MFLKKKEEERKSENTLKNEILPYFEVGCYCLDHFLYDFFHCTHVFLFICVTVHCISQGSPDKQKQ